MPSVTDINKGCGESIAKIALLRGQQVPETAPLRHMQFMDASGRKVPAGQVPDDWESLVLLVQQGASGRVFVAQRGGMDLAQQQELLKNTKFDDSLRWEDLDAALAALRHGHPLPNPASPLNDVARALWARTGLDQWDSLQRLSGQTTQGLISRDGRSGPGRRTFRDGSKAERANLSANPLSISLTQCNSRAAPCHSQSV